MPQITKSGASTFTLWKFSYQHILCVLWHRPLSKDTHHNAEIKMLFWVGQLLFLFLKKNIIFLFLKIIFDIKIIIKIY
jgi:hypothetical protein